MYRNEYRMRYDLIEKKKKNGHSIKYKLKYNYSKN